MVHKSPSEDFWFIEVPKLKIRETEGLEEKKL